MKKIKKIVAISLLVSLIFTIGNVNAFKKMDICNSTHGDFSGDYYDGKCTKDGKTLENIKNVNQNTNLSTNTGTTQENKEDKFIHKFKKVEFNLKINSNPLLMTFSEKTRNKDIQLCSIADHFDILDKEGNIKYTYYPQGCNKKEIDNSIENINKENNVDNILKNIFDTGDNVNKEKNTNSVDNIMEDDSENTYSEDIDSENNDTQANNEDIDINNILDNLFQGNIKIQNNVSLKGSKFAKTIKDYSKQKIIIRVGKTKANVLGDNINYSLSVASLLGKIDKEFKIDSIKNDFSKNISDLSYSYYTYKNTKDLETKNVFKNQLLKDILKLKKKYKVLKFKDKVISKTLEKRGEI